MFYSHETAYANELIIFFPAQVCIWSAAVGFYWRLNDEILLGFSDARANQWGGRWSTG